MSATDNIREKSAAPSDLASQIHDLADAIDGQENEGPIIEWPDGVDCLGGTNPNTNYNLSGDNDNGSANLLYYDRLEKAAPDGTVIYIGHSIVQETTPGAISPFALTLGYGGETMRRLMQTRINRLGSQGLIHRAGAVVIHTGVCDFGHAAYGAPSTHNACGMLEYFWNHLAPWMTGKWVVVNILPVDQAFGATGYSSEIDHANQKITEKLSALCNADYEIVDVKSQLIDGNGNLQSQYHSGDGVHLSKAGHVIVDGAIYAALQNLGVQ